jgi:hypothetical protein
VLQGSLSPKAALRQVIVIGLYNDPGAVPNRQEIADVLTSVMPQRAAAGEAKTGLTLALESEEVAAVEMEIRRTRGVADQVERNVAVRCALGQKPESRVGSRD